MADLITLHLSNGAFKKFQALDAAKQEALFHLESSPNLYIDFMPEGGGPMATLVFDKEAEDWAPLIGDAP